MKKWIATGVVLLFLGSSLPALGQFSEKSIPLTYEGNVLYVGGTGPGNYTTIQDAVKDSTNGDTVIVFPGFYQEHIRINSSITLKGIDHPIVDGNCSASVITLGASGITIDGFHVQNAGLKEDNIGGANIKCDKGNAIIKNNNISGLAGVGVYIYEKNDIFIINNTIQLTRITDLGIAADYCSRINISYNRFIKSVLFLIDLYDSVVYHNYFFDEGRIWCDGGGNLYFTSNLISNCNSTGIRIEYMEGGVYVYGNTFQLCHLGLLLGYSHAFQYIGKNNFLHNLYATTYTLNNFYTGTWLEYYSNYWDRPRILPKIIPGFRGYPKSIPYMTYPWIKIDWTPAIRPYDIPTRI
jgi:hypothetical protein